jgi:hypothetical protein
VEGYVYISGDGVVDLTPLSSLTYIAEDLRISTDELTSLAGLENLVSVGGSVRIGDNMALTSLTALESLISIGGFLHIHDNPITSLAGLDGLSSVGTDLVIRFNEDLAMCSCGLAGLISGSPPVFSGVGTADPPWGAEAIIGGNDPQGSCTSPEVVLATPCVPVANEDEKVTPKELRLNAYPNPTPGPLAVQYALPEAGPVRLSIYDLLGRNIAVLVDGVQPVGRHEVQISDIAAGVYVVQIEAGEEVSTQRVTVVE